MSLKINKDFAGKYESYRRKEELQKMKDRGLDDSGDDSTSEEEEDSPNFTKESTDGFFRALAALKSDAPEIYEKDAKFYNEEKSENTKSEKKEKEMTLKDFDREVAQKKGGVIDEEQEEMKVIDNQGKSYLEEQSELKKKFSQMAESSDEDDDGLLVKVTKTEKEEKSKKPKKSLKINDVKLDEGEMFVKNYLMNEAWNEEEDSDVDYSSGEELADRKYHKISIETKAEEESEESDEDLFERKLVEKDSDVSQTKSVRELKIERDENREPKSYPRGNAIQSVRVQTTKAEKKDQKRKEKKEKMKLAEKQYKEDMARQKNMKMAELKEKLESLQETLGISELDIDPNMLKGDFDPEAHEKLMSEVLKNYGEGEEEFDEDGEIVKPEFSDLEEWEEEIKAEKKKKKENRRKRRGKRGRVLEDDDFEVAKEKFPEIAKEIEELDYQVDLAGGVPCKFKYRETEKQDFGLSIDEMLNATDAELNTWVSLKQVTGLGTHVYGNEKFWSNPKKVEAKKKKVFKSLYGEENNFEEENDEEPKKKKKMNSKRRRKQKEKESQILDEQNSEDLEKRRVEEKLETAEPEDTEKVKSESKVESGKKNKKRRRKKEAKEEVLEMADDRLAAYGLDPKLTKKKFKYGPDQALKY